MEKSAGKLGELLRTFWQENRTFCAAALRRAVRTAAQTAAALAGVGTFLSDVDWIQIGSASALAGILSILTSLATGLPEADWESGNGGASGNRDLSGNSGISGDGNTAGNSGKSGNGSAPGDGGTSKNSGASGNSGIPSGNSGASGNSGGSPDREAGDEP